jgi:dimethylaniline monooxygenase (N-oxide forming)
MPLAPLGNPLANIGDRDMPSAADPASAKKICIIGAGVAGLTTAKVFLSQGHAVTMFEKVDILGGVWSPARRYPGVRLQTKRQHYAFSDFPMPPHYPEFPTGQQVYEYLCAYATRFGVDRAIRFRTEVRSVVPRPDSLPGWRVQVRDLATGGESASDFDFVIVCNGVFSEPHIPLFSGRNEFEAHGGIVLHSSQVSDAAILNGRDVVVIGFGKSALDLAEASLATARSTAIVCRSVPWKVPHRIGRANIKRFILTRFMEIWFPHPDMGRCRRALHTWLRPVVDLYWRLAEFVIGRKLGLFSPELRPDVPLRKSIPCVTLAIDNLRLIRDGKVALHRGSVARFTAGGLELQDHRPIAAEVVVLATGYRREFRFLRERERAALSDPSGAILLYRALINPDIPDMAFNGYNGVGVCQIAAEVGATWLVECIEGRVQLPERAAMMDTIRQELDLRKRLLSTKVGDGAYVTPFTFGYLDQLLRDLGLPPADQHRRLLDWLFTPLDPVDYRDLIARSAAARLHDTIDHPLRLNKRETHLETSSP